MSIQVSANEFAVISVVAMAVQNPYILEGFELISEKESASLSLEEAESLNNAVLNSGAGVFPKDPFGEWNSPKDKIKKSLDNYSSVVSKVGLAHPENGDQPFSYSGVMAEMSRAMSYNVGTGYNMASALTAATLFYSHNPSTDKTFVQEMETVCRKAWDILYEDLALSQDYKRGNPFYQLLQQSMSGCQNIPPAVEGGEWVRKTAEETLSQICSMFKEQTGADLSPFEARWFIWARRIVAGYKLLNREGIESFFKRKHYHSIEGKPNPGAANLVSLLPDSKANSMLPDILFVGIFRQLGQGFYGVDAAAEEEGTSQSVWELFEQYEDLILPHLPSWLRRKFIVSSLVWKEMIDQLREETKIESQNYDGMNKYRLSAPDDDFEGIPYVDLHACHARSAYGSGGIGAFETRLWACPIVPVAMANGVRLREANAEDLESGIEIKYFPRSAEKAGFECKVAGGAYWYYRNLSAKEIFQRAADRYPQGVILFSENNTATYQFIRFDALLKFGAFGSSESASGVSLRLVQLLIASQQYPEQRPSGWDSSAGGILASVLAGVRGMVNLGENADTTKRSKIIRLLGRSSVATGSYATKVMTSCARRVQDHRFERSDGATGRIPVVVLNPQDDIVLKGGFKAGDLLTVSRTPMISMFFAMLKLDDMVSVGNAEVRASVFKQFTSGDGDGKP